MRHLQKLLILSAVLALLLPTAFAAEKNSCPAFEACSSALMYAAREGDRAGELRVMGKIFDLREASSVQSVKPARLGVGNEAVGVGNADATLRNILATEYGYLEQRPEHQRLAIQALLQANRPDDAMQVLKRVLPLQPSFAPFWIDLATTYAAKGKDNDAVSALVVAHNWAIKPAVLLQAYEEAAQAPGTMSRIFGEAVSAINSSAAGLARLEASVPLPDVDSTTGRPVAVPVANFATCTKPHWPRASVRYGETGKVTLSFLVDTSGKVVHAKVLQSSGHFELDHAVLAGMARCGFSIVRKGDAPVSAWASLQYVWAIED